MFSWKNKKLDQMDMSKLIRSSGSYAILIAAMGAMTFFGVCDPSQDRGGPTGTAAEVGGEKVTGIEFRRMFDYYSQAYGGGRMDQSQIARLVLDALVNRRAAYSAAVQVGIRASDDEVDRVILAESERFKSEDGKFSATLFRDFLRANRLTEQDYAEEIRRDLSMKKYEALVSETLRVSADAALIDYQVAETKFAVRFLKIDPSKVKVSITKQEIADFLDDAGKTAVKEYFDRQKSEYERPAEVKARHVLVAFQGARNAAGAAATRSKEDAMKRAETALARLKVEGADFKKVAAEFTDEPAGKDRGGDLGWFRRETMVKEFADAAFALNKDQISGIVESPFGFHIIKVEGKKAENNRTLADVTDEIAEKLLLDKKRPEIIAKKTNELHKKLTEKANVGDLLGSLGAKWEDTGEFSANSRSIPKIGSAVSIKDAILALRENQNISPVVTTGDYRYIFQLVKRSQPALQTITPEKVREIRENQRMTEARTLVAVFRAAVREKLEERGDIWINPAYELKNRVPDEDGAA